MLPNLLASIRHSASPIFSILLLSYWRGAWPNPSAQTIYFQLRKAYARQHLHTHIHTSFFRHYTLPSSFALQRGVPIRLSEPSYLHIDMVAVVVIHANCVWDLAFLRRKEVFERICIRAQTNQRTVLQIPNMTEIMRPCKWRGNISMGKQGISFRTLQLTP